ncbi:MAG: ABC transporter ATP-binding protein [Spirochaetota bacterium]
MADDIIISARGVKRLFTRGKEDLWALKGIDLDIYRGEYLSIMGPSGSGKSTFFNIVGGLDSPTEGTVTIDGTALSDMDTHQIAYLRCHKVGYIFQTFNIIEVMTALENVMLPLFFAGVSDKEAKERAMYLLERVGLKERADHRPDQLSGGQQQRVAIARALANNPTIILADEPTGNLDLKTGEMMIAMLGEIKKEFGITIISATHDHKMLSASDRIVYIVDGNIAEIKDQRAAKAK